MKKEIIKYLLSKGFKEIEPNVLEASVKEYRQISINGQTNNIPVDKTYTFKIYDGAWIGNSEEDNTPLVQISFSFNKKEQEIFLVESLEDFKKIINI